ncbi:hypothetical protein HMPREF9123_0372 [Neisseria bacilliformis ATCC BAA-1200]|uniref:Uncharacterized protein n=1 Tax=Neisseria bacilliformis ATCC BAA-1200 TaxID=888742 RepID=F2B9E6_9NEIS|nr:hypothetical protein HMPREF9123_0372 [Neisseria bacilliformis ATCC BAA-1200]
MHIVADWLEKTRQPEKRRDGFSGCFGFAIQDDGEDFRLKPL